MNSKCLRFLAICLCLTLQNADNANAREFTIKPDVIYGHKAGMALTMDVIEPEKPNGAAILFLVSGGWVSTWAPPEYFVRKGDETPNYFESILDRGYTLILVRHGSAPQFKVPEVVQDVRRAVRFVQMNALNWNIDPNRIGVTGFSAGGHLSLMLGTTADAGDPTAQDVVEKYPSKVAAVVSVFPPTTLQEYFVLKETFKAMEFDESLADSVSPLRHVTSDDAPTFLVHGDKDELVPLYHSENIKKAFEENKVPTELMVMKDVGHSIPDEISAEVFKRSLDWFDLYLKPAANP